MYIDPSDAQVQAIVSSEAAGPVVMLNLLRFREQAEGMDVSGLEAYLEYSAAVQPHLARVGGEVVWAGACTPAVIGPSDVEWDVAAIVRYPSRAAFVAMVTDADYLKISTIRSASLADSRLIPCDSMAS